MASRFIAPVFDAGSGIKPSSGAKLSFFESGTNTPKDTFTSGSAITPNTNPVIADSNGVFPDIFISGTYKVILTDKNGSQAGFGEKDPITELVDLTVINKLNPDTLAAAIADSTLLVDDVIEIREVIAGNGGSVSADVVLLSSVIPNLSTIFASTGNNTLAIKIRISATMSVDSLSVVGDGITDNTAVYSDLVKNIIEGTELTWGPGKVYIGNLVSELRGFNLNLGNATLTNKSTSESIIRFGELNAEQHIVSESTLNNLDREFTVIGASTLFSQGDIGYLWDGAIRPTGGSVNFESVKIESISGDLITIVGFLASFKGASTISFFHSANQLKNVTVTGGLIKPTDSHFGFGVASFNTEKVVYNGIGTENTTGQAVVSRFSYDVDITNIRPVRPFAVTSGLGYGVALFGVNLFKVDNVKADGTRHAFDADSCYFGTVRNISDFNDQSSPCTLAHNGFGGYIDCTGVRTRSLQFPINLSEGGYGGTPSADKGKHPFRSINIDIVDNVIPSSKTVNEFNVPGVYFQNSIIDCTVEDVTVRHESSVALEVGSNSNLIRVNGIMKGSCEFTNLSVDKINTFLFSSGDRDGLSTDGVNIEISNASATSVNRYVHTIGFHSVTAKNLEATTDINQLELIFMQDISGDEPQYVNYTGIKFPLSLSVTYVNTDGFTLSNGFIEPKSLKTGLSISLINNQTLTSEEVQSRTIQMQAQSPVGSGSIDVFLPPPNYNGQEAYIFMFAGSRFDTVFKAGTTLFSDFTLVPGEQTRLIAFSGKWSSRYVI